MAVDLGQFHTGKQISASSSNTPGPVLPDHYRPQRSCGQGYVFTCMCDSVHRGIMGVSGQGELPLAGRTPLGKETPPCRENPRWQGDTPQARRHPLARRPPQARRPPRQGDPPGRENPPPAIRSMSGRYASYWNAFLLIIISTTNCYLTLSFRR